MSTIIILDDNDMPEEDVNTAKDAKNTDSVKRRHRKSKPAQEENNAIMSAYSSLIEQNIETFRSEHKDEPNKDIVRCVKRVIFCDKKGIEDEELDVLIPTFRKIVEICGLDVKEYDIIYSTKTNKKMYLENLSRKITDLASDECKEECAFQRKRMLLKMVYPEYYEANYEKIRPYELFFVNGENKACLARAAKPSPDNEDNTKSSDGAIVDRLIFNAINESFAKIDITDKLKIMQIISDEKKIRAIANPTPMQKNTVPGCFSIINERQCYKSYLDFYFLNMSKEDQLFLVDDFMQIRRQAGIEPIPLLEKLYSIYTENRDIFLDNYYENL